MSNSQIIYILSNEAMPGILKIGRTWNLKERMKDLDNSSVPMPFECAYAALVEDAIFVERQLHTIFASFRVRGRREFFRIDPAPVIAAIELVEVQSLTPSEDADEAQIVGSSRVLMFNPEAYSKEAAEADVAAFLKDDDFIPGMTVLASRWKVTKGCVSKWIDDFCQRGLVEKVRVGRHMMLVKPGATRVSLGQIELGRTQSPAQFPECSVQRDGDSLSDTLSSCDPQVDGLGNSLRGL